MYLKCKLQQDNYGSFIFKWKSQKFVQKTYWQRSKPKKRYSWCFQMLKWLRERQNYFFALCQQTSQLQYMHLAFGNLKISSKKGQQKSKS